MRKLALFGACALVLCLAATTAHADKVKHRGSVKGAPDSSVKFALKKRNGELIKVTNLKFKRIPVVCEDGAGGEIQGELSNFGVKGRKFRKRGRIQGTGIENGRIRVKGQFRKKGKRAEGRIKIAFQASSGQACGTDDARWKTRKK